MVVEGTRGSIYKTGGFSVYLNFIRFMLFAKGLPLTNTYVVFTKQFVRSGGSKGLHVVRHVPYKLKVGKTGKLKIFYLGLTKVSLSSTPPYLILPPPKKKIKRG